ncbi:hypothetical protein D5085_00265 [Ectothiorhodospiraceae bacterium BW-2]|nr:hypothetical protein D5085_00265 [Ectothiorhodospiraceae bacterium BW-2]
MFSNRPNSSTLFTRLSQFNAIVGSLFMLMVLMAILFALWQAYQQWRTPIIRPNIVKMGEHKRLEEQFELGHSEPLSDSTILLPLYSRQSYTLSSYGSKETQSTRNLLFIEGDEGTMRWLFPTNEWLIYHYRQLLAPDTTVQESNSDRTVALLYQIIKQDSNGDSQLSEGDSFTLAISQPDGRSYRELISGVLSLLGVHTTSKQLLLFYNDHQRQPYQLTLSLPHLTSLFQHEIPLPAPPNRELAQP